MAMPTIDDVRELVWRDHKPPLGEETPEQTLNRLWVKHRGSRERRFGEEFVSGPPDALTAENTSVVSENEYESPPRVQIIAPQPRTESQASIVRRVVLLCMRVGVSASSTGAFSNMGRLDRR